MLLRRRARGRADRDGDRGRGGAGGRARGGGAARRGSGRGRRGAGDARELRAAVRARDDRRRAEPAPPREGRVPRARSRRPRCRSPRANGARGVDVSVPGRGDDRARPRARRGRASTVRVGRASGADDHDAAREAELGPAATIGFAAGGGYDGPLAYRQGKPMRPDVALAFDRMEAAARADGVALVDHQRLPVGRRAGGAVEPQPEPEDGSRGPARRCTATAPSSTSARRAAYAWLAANAGRFHFLQRYSWEPWHFGYTLNPSRASQRETATARRACRTARCRASCRRGSPRCCAAPRSAGTCRRRCSPRRSTPSRASTRSRARRPGAQGIAQFMPATARAFGLANPFDAEQAIDAQAHLMRDLLRQFGSRAARARRLQRRARARVGAAGASRTIPETRGYVARILGLMSGAGPAASRPATATRSRSGWCGDVATIASHGLRARRSPRPAAHRRARSCAWSSAGHPRRAGTRQATVSRRAPRASS